LSNLVGEADKFIGQLLEALIIADLLLDLRGLLGRDALGAFFALEEALQHKIGAVLDGAALLALFEELPAQGAAAQVVDGAHLLEDSVAFLSELLGRTIHGLIVYIQIQLTSTKTSPQGYPIELVTYLSRTRCD
jgi:hypothetical protein